MSAMAVYLPGITRRQAHTAARTLDRLREHLADLETKGAEPVLIAEALDKSLTAASVRRRAFAALLPSISEPEPGSRLATAAAAVKAANRRLEDLSSRHRAATKDYFLAATEVDRVLRQDRIDEIKRDRDVAAVSKIAAVKELDALLRELADARHQCLTAENADVAEMAAERFWELATAP